MPPTFRPSVVPPVVAEPKIVIDALTEVADAEVIVPLTPAFPDNTAVAPVRFVPVNTTGNDVPTVPKAGDTDVTDVAAMTVKGTV